MDKKKKHNKIKNYRKLLDETPALVWESGFDAKLNYFNKSWLT